MVGEPNTGATLQLQTLKTNSTFLSNVNSFKSYNLTVEFVVCEIGDVYNKKSRICYVCPSGSYSLTDPYGNDTVCRQCPFPMKCLGGNKMVIETGYWRYNTSKTNIIRCEEDSICRGGLVNEVYYPHGLCAFPNEGNMCNECPPKYAKFGSSSVCVDCEKDAEYHIKAICFFMLQIVIISYIFKSKKEKTRFKLK